MSKAFCVISFLGILWFLSVYLAWQLRGLWDDRQWQNRLRRNIAQMYESPWYAKPPERIEIAHNLDYMRLATLRRRREDDETSVTIH